VSIENLLYKTLNPVMTVLLRSPSGMGRHGAALSGSEDGPDGPLRTWKRKTPPRRSGSWPEATFIPYTLTVFMPVLA
jgi:hypothetical protein